MVQHVNAVCKKGYYQLTKIRQIQKYMEKQAVESLVHSFVTSHMDYCNSLLYGCPAFLIGKHGKLQRLQNCAARVITGTIKYDHITPVLKELHWLPIVHRIDYKIALLTYKCLHGQAPEYLKDLISKYNPQRQLRSSKLNLLNIPLTNTKTLGPRAFTYSSPFVWNSLPEHVKIQDSICNFKTALKTFLFQKAYK